MDGSRWMEKLRVERLVVKRRGKRLVDGRERGIRGLSQDAIPIWKQQPTLQPILCFDSLRTRAIKQPSASNKVNPTTSSGWRSSLTATLLFELKETSDKSRSCIFVCLVKVLNQYPFIPLSLASQGLGIRD